MSTKSTEKDSSAVKPVVDPFVQEVERIVLAKHSEPFRILGPHWIEREGTRSLAVRAFRPGAIGASVRLGPIQNRFTKLARFTPMVFSKQYSLPKLRSQGKRAAPKPYPRILIACDSASPMAANSKPTIHTRSLQF